MRSREAGGFLEMLGPIATLMMMAGGLTLVLSLGYLLYGVTFAGESLFSHTVPGGGKMSAADVAIQTRNIGWAAQGVLLGGLAALLGAFLRFWSFAELAAGLVVAGAAIAFGVPFYVTSRASSFTPSDPGVVALINPTATLAGTIIGGMGAALLLIHAVGWLVDRASNRRRVSTDVAGGALSARGVERTDKFLGACWTLPFCRDTVKKACPIRQKKRACWKDGRGCYCDQQVVLMLSGDRGKASQAGASPGSVGFVPAYQLTAGPRRNAAEKRMMCLGCPVYLHRQQQKYRLLAPLSVAAIAAGVYFIKDWFGMFYPTTLLAMGRLLGSFSFGAPTEGGVPAWVTDMAQQTFFMWMILILVAVILLAYLLRVTEWALYKLGV